MTDDLSDLRMLCAYCTELCSTAEGDVGGSNDIGLNDGVLLPHEGLLGELENSQPLKVPN